MKLRLTGATFDASAKTVTHASFSDVTLAGILLIVNVTDQEIIYSFADTAKGGTLSTDTLTLEHDTTSMSDTDELLIFVDDGAATSAISGTVTANLSATDNAVLDAIEADTTTIAGAVSGSEMQVDVLTIAAGDNNIGNVDVASSALPTGASTSAKQDTVIGHLDGVETLLGTIDADTGNIVTSVQLLDDAVYAEDVAAQAADKGLAVLAVRRDADTSLVGTDNDYAQLQVNANGALKVEVFDGGDSHTVDGTVTANLAAGTNNIGDVDIASIAAGDNNIGNVDIASALPAGTNAIGKLAANSGVDIGDVDVTSVVPGTGATNLGKAEDGAHTTGDVGVMALGVRDDTTPAVVSGTTGDYEPFHTDENGNVWVSLGTKLAPTIDSVAVNQGTQDLATDATAHVKKYYTNAGAVTDGIIWSPAAGKRWYVTDLIINVSAACTVTLEDDKAGGDEAVMKFELAANSGISHSFNTPWYSGEDAADLIITTTAGNVYVTVTGYEI